MIVQEVKGFTDTLRCVLWSVSPTTSIQRVIRHFVFSHIRRICGARLKLLREHITQGLL